MDNEKSDTNEIQKVKPQAIEVDKDAPAMVQIVQLLANGVDIDVDKIAKLQDMAEKDESHKARKAFFAAMPLVQSEIEGVYRNKRNPQTNSNYATLDVIIEVAKPIYTKHGFSVIFSEGKSDKEGNIRILADVMHMDGHERSYYRDLDLDDKGIKGAVNKTQIHGKASSFSYGRRYLMCDIWNISTPDNDGNTAPPPPPKRKPINEVDNIQLDKVLKRLPEKPGFKFNRGRIMAIFMENGRPPNDADLEKGVKWLLDKYNDVDIYTPLPIDVDGSELPGEFE